MGITNQQTHSSNVANIRHKRYRGLQKITNEMRDSYGSQLSMFTSLLFRKSTLPQVMSIKCRFQGVEAGGALVCGCVVEVMWNKGRESSF